MEAEIRGDWNNIRGTEYHFVYALWLVITNKVPAVWFYKGNDLLATPELEAVPPPVFDEGLENDVIPSVPLRTGTEKMDEWIQLKATREPWTVTKVLEDNLLFNFICNAYHSESKGRGWKVSLISQGEARSKALTDFINDPTKSPESNERLGAILEKAKIHLKKVGWKNTKKAREELDEIVKSIFGQIAYAEPISLDLLKKGIETELAYSLTDREAVNSSARQLLGAMLLDSSKGPKDGHTYDAEWVNRSAGTPVLDRGMLDRDPAAACNKSIARHASSIRYEAGVFVKRQEEASTFLRFLKSDSPLYVLLGTSGTGKSWIAFHAARELLHDQIRLFVSGDALSRDPSLAGIVARELRNFTTANWQNDQFLNRFISAGLAKDSAPILFIDDIGVGNDPDRVRHNLSYLVAECKMSGVRLVLTCQKQIWEFSRLASEIDAEEIFSDALGERTSSYNLSSDNTAIEQDSETDEPERSPSAATASEPNGEIQESQNSPSQASVEPPKVKRHSYVLGDFSADEMVGAVRLLLPGSQGEWVADKLRTPAFISLRRPFFLGRYIKMNRDGWLSSSTLPVADVDALLDQTVDLAVQKAAIQVRLCESDVLPALNLLTGELWRNRERSITYPEVLKLLEPAVGPNASGLIEVWRRNGFLTAEEGIRLSDPLLSDRIFARRFANDLIQFAETYLIELDPRIDFGVVVAYMRRSEDPVSVAEILLEKDESWSVAVVAGLGQVRLVDWKVLAFLSALLAKNRYTELSRDIYSVFGQIASRSKDAFRFVAGMYLGTNGGNSRDGALAAISLTEYDPRSTEKLIRTRLRRLVAVNREFRDRDKRRKKVLDDALTPLRSINHVSAAEAGKRLLVRYNPIVGSDDDDYKHWPREWDFVEALDDTRGRLALFDTKEYDRLLVDLESTNPIVRFRATQALISIAKDRPNSITTVLCGRIVNEKDASTVKRLLIAAYQLIAYAPLELLNAIRSSKISRLSDGYRHTDGLVFELLGNLAEKHGAAVAEILPNVLDRPDRDVIALSGEMFTYAWWRALEGTNGNSDHEALNAMSILDPVLESKELYGLVLRTRVVALLAKICIDLGVSAAPLSGLQRFYSGLSKDFLYIYLDDFFEENLSKLSSHPRFEELTDLMIECVQKSDPVDIYPLSRLKHAVFRCGSNCLRMLTITALASRDPVSILEKLPAGWQAIRAATEVLSSGRAEPELVEFSKRILEAQKGATTVQADAESLELRARLGLLEEDAKKTIQDQRDAARRMPFGGMRNTEALIFTTNREPQKFLEFLEAAISDVEDIVTLYDLVSKAETWESVLVSRVYARMLNDKEIVSDEGKVLSQQMLLAAEAMEMSPRKQDYQLIYGAILQILDGSTPPLLTDTADAEPQGKIISHSHSQAITIINKILLTEPDERSEQWLNEIQNQEKWWHESSRFEFRDLGLAHGSGLFGIYFFPAVRLALLAAGRAANVRDPAARIMMKRGEINELLREGHRLLNWYDLTGHDEEYIKEAFDDLDKAAAKNPRDERIEALRGAILLRLRRLDEAESAFGNALKLPTNSAVDRAGIHYDLACIFSLRKEPARCREALFQSAKLRPLSHSQLSSDKDLDWVRNEPWFEELLSCA